MKFPEKMLLKLPAGTLGRIDAVASNRSDFVRAAIEAALSGNPIYVDKSKFPPPPEPVTVAPKAVGSAPVPKKKSNVSVGGSLRPDDDVLLSYVHDHPRRTERALCEGLDWPAMRVSKSVARLGAAGLVRLSGGAVEAV